MESVHLRYGVYLARLEVDVTISQSGLLRYARTENKSYGDGDHGGLREKVEIREGQLRPEQMAELGRMFEGWVELSSEPYGGVPDSGEIEVWYGVKRVWGGSDAPVPVKKIRVRVEELAGEMNVVVAGGQSGNNKCACTPFRGAD